MFVRHKELMLPVMSFMEAMILVKKVFHMAQSLQLNQVHFALGTGGVGLMLSLQIVGQAMSLKEGMKKVSTTCVQER